MEFAKVIYKNWNNGTLIKDINSMNEITPKNKSESYAVQNNLIKLSQKGIFGWKVAASNKAGQEHIGVSAPLAGVLLKEKKFDYNETIDLLPNQMLVAEVEFIFKMKSDLDFSKSSYSKYDTLLIIDSLHGGIELPDSRYVNFTEAGETNLIADNACANQFILGPKLSNKWQNKNLHNHKVFISVNNETFEHGLGKNVLGSPVSALNWLLNEFLEFKIPLKKGHFVATGTVTKPIQIKKGDVVKADYSDLGNFQISLI